VVPRRPTAFAAHPEQPFLLSVAQHRKNKNLNLLIQAHAALLKSGQLPETAQLVLVGSSGPETTALQQQIAELQLQSSVQMLASLNDSELCWLYQHCQLYVVCSATEGFCLPLAEALYLGCKVVCSDIPILREVAITDCTYFSLEGDSAQNLVQAIATAIQQPAQINRQNLRFSKSAIAKQYFNFYLKVMARYD
jgi:glycosyltransferase involved in cell wall biosynthesis